MLDDIVSQSRRVADRLDTVLDAAIDGALPPADAAQIGYVGVVIAANNAVALSAIRMRGGLPPLPEVPRVRGKG